MDKRRNLLKDIVRARLAIGALGLVLSTQPLHGQFVTRYRAFQLDGNPRRATGVEMATQTFRLRPTMKQGTAAGIPETWTHYL